VTSFTELAREARNVERRNRLHPDSDPQIAHVQSCLKGHAPVVAATDYVRAVPQLISSYVEAPFTVLGTDGFGRSDTRAALREFFEVDRHQLVLAALTSLANQGVIGREVCGKAIAHYGIRTDDDASWEC